MRSPPKLDQYELLYNSAVQSFVRRDHVKTQATLARLLDLTRALPRTPSPWYDVASTAAPQPGDEWMTKTLKLAISANASLYSDPPRQAGALAPDVADRLPPASPRQMLGYILDLCVSTYGSSLLPPALVSTFLLASLKLQPLADSLEFAHELVEDWLANLPDEFVLAIAADPHPHPRGTGGGGSAAARKKRLENAREGYLKVVEIFIGEVLSREGEWEMARGMLEGEMVMGSKKKEALYRHLRNVQAKPVSQAPSPAASGLLPPQAQSQSQAQVRSTESEASSEATARPAGHQPHGHGHAPEDASTLQPSDGSDSTVPAAPRPHAHSHSRPHSRSREHDRDRDRGEWGERGEREHDVGRPRAPPRGWLTAVLSPYLVDKIHAAGGLHVVLGVPAAAVVAVLLVLRRVRARAGRLGLAAGGTDVRDRLRRVRSTGLGALVQWALRWWADKLAGVWRLGTTITYM